MPHSSRGRPLPVQVDPIHILTFTIQVKTVYLNVPRRRIIARDDNGVALLDERSSRVVPQISQQSQDLVGDGAHLHGDIPLPSFQVLWSILARCLVEVVF